MRAKQAESRARETPIQTERRLAAARDYRKRHVDKTGAERVRRHLLAHPEKRRQARLKRRQNALYRLSDTIRIGICNSFRGVKSRRKWERIVGYSLDVLARHLERQFVRGMSWQNFGSYWQVDHIVPLAHFRKLGASVEVVATAWALTNLRPLEGVKNLQKGGRRIYLI